MVNLIDLGSIYSKYLLEILLAIILLVKNAG